MMRSARFGLLALVLATSVGCGSSADVEVVDLNKVLDVFSATLDELDEKHKDKGETDVKAVEESQENDEQRTEFVQLYAQNLNAAKVSTKPVVVDMTAAGDIEGYSDANSNQVHDSGEKRLFKLQIDEANNRVVATDDTYYRDHSYRPRGGFFTGYLIGSMLGRNRSYYSGSRAASKPDLSSKKMSSRDYHKGAVAKARSRARTSSRSSRGRSGSRGFSFGK